ncbi:hypothetical protein HDK64DRAFT_310370 [Phyllosticta capitalensis]
MLFLHLLLAILAITPLTDARIRRWKCGSTSPTKGFLDGTHYIIAMEKSDAASRLHTREEEPYLPRISFPVVFHILDNPCDIILTETMLAEQFDILKTTFAAYNIDFYLQSHYYYEQSDWAAGQDYLEMGRQIRVGGYDTLNIYILEIASNKKGPDEEALGISSFPEWSEHIDFQADEFWKDGVQLTLNALVGNPFIDQGPEDEGKTLVNEVGHWLGLMHTFHHGCHPDFEHGGDMVLDTPPQYKKLGSRWPNPDTCHPPGTVQQCSADLGFPPNLVDNYMDYIPDACALSFTKGQTVRMNRWGLIRKELRVIHGIPPGAKEPRFPYQTDASALKAKAEL